ncbi:MAG: sensor histidine kinase, partial [Candidatus Saccharimonadales bacterium]
PLTRAFVSGDIISDRIIYRHKDGHMVRLALTISPIMVAGQPAGSIQIFRDIGNEYEIDKMKSDFISLASHQLRTPLSSVKTYSHMLLDGFMGPLSKPQIKALKTIVTAANRMNETVSTLLNISRIENGAVIAERKPLSINKIFDSVVEDHGLASSEKSIAFKVKYPPGNPKLISDGIVLKEVLGNLVSNAIKYTPASGTVTISGKTKNDQLIISVSDTGVGIPSASHPNVFSKFFRAENVVRQETSGIGLGLYLVKGLMNELGGEVWFVSEEGKGTTFYLSLPLLPPLKSKTKPTDGAKRKVKIATAKSKNGMA